MDIKSIISEHYPNDKNGINIKEAKLINGRFIYVELMDGRVCFYEMVNGELFIYRYNNISNKVDNQKWSQIFRDSKINSLID